MATTIPTPLCWLMTVMTAMTAMTTFAGSMSTSPTSTYRLWIAAGITILVIFSGWFWSMSRLTPAKGESKRQK